MKSRNSFLIGKAFKSYIVASVLTVAATQVANIVDAAIVGNLIGPEALASVNLCKPVLQTIFAVSCLYIPSATILAGIAIGKGDKVKANKFFSFTILTSLLLGVLFCIVGLVAFHPLSSLLCSSDNLRPMTNDFLRVTILSAIPQLIMYSVDQFVTTDGAPKLITRAVVVGNLFNIFFDIVFIKYCGLGISGAAWATFIMYVVCILMVLPHFRKKDSLRFCMPQRADIPWGRLIALGLPLFLSTVLLAVQMWGSNYVAATYLGDGGLIALAVCMQLFAFSMIILSGTLRTIHPIGSILKGLDDHQGMRFLLRRAYVFLAVCLAIYAVAIAVFPADISLLLGAANEQSLPVILAALPLFSLHIVMQALLYNFMPVYQLYDHKKLAMFLSIGQTLLPMVGFWLLKGGWIGFFLGQLVVALVIIVASWVIRRKQPSLSPLLLIPKSDPKVVYDVTIAANEVDMKECLTELFDFLLSQGLSQQQANSYMLCAEELLVNIVRHGHAQFVDVRATQESISLHDNGKPFNPLEYKVEGEGLGLRIVQGTNLDIKYDYRFNQNMITIKSR